MDEKLKFIFILVGSIALALCLFLLIGRFLFQKTKNRRRGKKGEQEVSRRLGGNKRGRQFVLDNLLFQRGENSCEIDHVLINERGIWVIETKNYSGLIVGAENEREWTQSLKGGEIRNTFYNPVKQNATHIQQLSRSLKVEEKIFQNVVVFLSNADLSRVHSSHVCFISDLQTVLSQRTGISLSKGERKSFYRRIKRLTKEFPISKRDHVKQIKKRQKQIQRGICPRCGGKLVLREGKYVCSRFPNCKFIKE